MKLTEGASLVPLINRQPTSGARRARRTPNLIPKAPAFYVAPFRFAFFASISVYSELFGHAGVNEPTRRAVKETGVVDGTGIEGAESSRRILPENVIAAYGQRCVIQKLFLTRQTGLEGLCHSLSGSKFSNGNTAMLFSTIWVSPAL